jgi:hypothetical protein
MHAEVCIEKKNQPSFFSSFKFHAFVVDDDDDDDGLPILSETMV